MGNFKALLFSTICILVCCNTSNEVKIDRELTKLVKSNKDCLDILDNYYGVDSKKIEESKYIETLLSRYIDLNQNKKYTRFLFLRLEVIGEVIESSTFSIGELSNGQLEAVKYFTKDGEVKSLKKVPENQNISNLYKFFEKNSSQYSTGRILILDFTSGNSSCSFYNNISLQDIEKIKNLAFFK